MVYCTARRTRALIDRSELLTQKAFLLALTPLLPLVASAQQQPRDPPPAVVVAAVEMQAVDKSSRFIGNIQAIQSVEFKARVEGFLEQVAFQQGSMVDAGQLLYQIEQAQYKAALDSAEGQAAAAKADSDSATASLLDKQADFERQSVLIKKGDTSQTAFDQSKAQRDEAKADVEKAAASEQQAAASVETARINLGYTTVKSPIKGRIGATTYTQGNLVGPDSGTLATVVQLDPIRAVFSIPSTEFVRIMGNIGKASAEQYRAKFVPELILPTGDRYAHPGTIAFADNQVNTSTGTVAVYADFPNPEGLLLPGQFITALVGMAQKQSLPVVPAAALQRTRDGEQVYVVGTDNRVQLRKIKTGAKTDGGYAVASGLTEGELVIVSGIQKVKPGMLVAPSRQGAATEPKPASAKSAADKPGIPKPVAEAESPPAASASAEPADAGQGGEDQATGDAASAGVDQ
jgi:membrane fusion protein (multidrug efflux system)